MKKGQTGEGTVIRVDFPNRGIVLTEENEQLVVKNTIPGQRVSFCVNKARKGKAEGRLMETLERSPLETETACPHFGVCGGCTYQTLPYAEQLALKEAQVRKLIEQAVGGRCEYEFLGIKGSPREREYRNKMEFSFGDEYLGGPLALGMHRRGSFYDIVTVADCQIVDADFRMILTETLAHFSEKGAPFYHRMRQSGYLRHLLVRKAAKTGELLVDLVTTTMQVASEEEMLKGWALRLAGLQLDGKMKGILHTRNDSVADIVKDEGTDVLWGEPFFYEELLGLRFQISPFSFFQTNSLGAELLYETARAFIVGDTPERLTGRRVYDLYSGTGTIAQILAPICGEVVGVEIVEEAVAAARENAALNGLSNCRFLAGDVLKVLDTIEERPDFIVLDPPRDGIHPKALEKIIAYGVDKLVYISCKPTSLARDLDVFLARGYAVEKVCCVDMFPATYHVETVCLLSKLHSDKHIEVEVKMDEMDLTATESKATYEKIKEHVLKQTGLKVSSLYIAQVKKKCGIIERENYNLSKLKDAKQPICPPKKEKAIMDALEHFGMV